MSPCVKFLGSNIHGHRSLETFQTNWTLINLGIAMEIQLIIQLIPQVLRQAIIVELQSTPSPVVMVLRSVIN